MEGRLTLGTSHLRISCISWLTVADWPMIEDSTESTRTTVRGTRVVTFSILTRKLQGTVCIILTTLLSSTCWDEVDKKYYLVIYIHSPSHSFVHIDTKPTLAVTRKTYSILTPVPLMIGNALHTAMSQIEMTNKKVE